MGDIILVHIEDYQDRVVVGGVGGRGIIRGGEGVVGVEVQDDDFTHQCVQIGSHKDVVEHLGDTLIDVGVWRCVCQTVEGVYQPGIPECVNGKGVDVGVEVAKNYHEQPFETPESMTVTAFSSLGGFISRSRVRELGEDSVRVLGFLKDLLGTPAGVTELTVSLIPSTHGQAFDGLIHIGDLSTVSDRVAERELFRAHEIAHLWWGHLVGWHSYRDQWLSEGFAEYSAMLFVEENVDKGQKFFDEMLQAFSDELTG